MTRCANCIQMLQMLKSRGFMSRKELAVALKCNIRNIGEYRKELEEAGFEIVSTSGKYGGYILKSDCLLPSLSLSDTEMRSVKEMRDYLNSHQDFIMKQEMNSVFDKILSDDSRMQINNSVYLYNEQYILSNKLRNMIQIMEQAIQTQKVIEITYRSMKDDAPNSFRIHPYEIINYMGAYYCIAYSLKAKDFRIYKFSEERMKQVTIKEETFLRDRKFDIKHHIGQSGLIKDEVIEVEMEIYDEAAIFCAEKRIGIQQRHEWKDEHTLYFSTIFEGKQAALSFILSLGEKAKVMKPKYLAEEIKAQAKAIQKRYDGNNGHG